jgi:hypothetical protein
MSALNLRASGCTPYFCNEFEKNNNGKCSLCKKTLTDTHQYKYPVPAHSVYADETETPDHFVALNVQKIIPSDNMGGKSHRYACASCVSKQKKIKVPDLSSYPCSWVEETDILEAQILEGNRIASEDLRVDDVDSYHPNAMNFLRQIGDMGLSDADVSNQHPPMATIYREIDEVKQCIEFVHFDKFYGMKIDAKHPDPSKRSPCFGNYEHHSKLLEMRKKKNAISFGKIYDETKFVNYFNKKTKQTHLLNLLENERQDTASGPGFGAHSVFKQEQNCKLSDRECRWWDQPFSFIILNSGVEVGMIEFFIMNHDSRNDLHHKGKSLFIYNIAADVPGHKITQCALWFAKYLALYLNRFTDISTEGSGRIKRVFLSTSKLNRAFERDAPKCGFTVLSTLKEWWDCDYYCDLPWVQRYRQGSDVFPTNITGTGPEGSYINPEIYKDSTTILDSVLRPAPGEIDPYAGQKRVIRNSRHQSVDVERDILPEYKYTQKQVSKKQRKK